MTSKELYKKILPDETKTYTAQLLCDGLNVNLSGIYDRLIKDAARCNSYSSDIRFSIYEIDEAMKTFDPRKEFDPIWIGFRRMGVDHANFILARINDDHVWGDLFHNYFALYSLNVEYEEEGFYKIIFNQYYM